MSRSSKFTGVSFAGSARKSPWRVRITFSGSTLNLGYFKSEKQAALMYNDFIKANELSRSLNSVR